MKDYIINGAKWLVSQMHPGIPVHFRAPLGAGGPTVLADALKTKGKTLYIGSTISECSCFKQNTFLSDAEIDVITCKPFIDYVNDYLAKYDSFVLGKNVHARYRVPILATLQATDKYIISL